MLQEEKCSCAVTQSSQHLVIAMRSFEVTTLVYFGTSHGYKQMLGWLCKAQLHFSSCDIVFYWFKQFSRIRKFFYKNVRVEAVTPLLKKQVLRIIFEHILVVSVFTKKALLSVSWISSRLKLASFGVSPVAFHFRAESLLSGNKNRINKISWCELLQMKYNKEFGTIPVVEKSGRNSSPFSC